MSSENCESFLNSSFCICPVDRRLEDCSGYRPFQCFVSLLNSPEKCNDLERQTQSFSLSRDPQCLVFALDERASLKYSLSCRFADQSDSNPSPDVNFTYYISTKNFSIFSPVKWKIWFKIFDFNVLSDNEESTMITLSKSQIEGNEAFWFNTSVPIGKLDVRYWHGNRIYMETYWSRDGMPPGISEVTLDRRFIDSPDYRGYSTDSSNSIDTKIIIIMIVIGLSVTALISLVVYKLYRISKRMKLVSPSRTKVT